MIEPVDETRCQAEFRDGSFMSFGPRKLIRCSNVPIVIAEEKEPGKDGERGQMSLCKSCWEEFQRRTNLPACTFRLIHVNRNGDSCG